MCTLRAKQASSHTASGSPPRGLSSGHGGPAASDDGGSATGADLLPASVSFNNERTTTALNSAAGACSCRAAWRIATL